MITAMDKIEKEYTQLISNNKHDVILLKADLQRLYEEAKLQSYDFGIIKVGSKLCEIHLSNTEYTKAIELVNEIICFAKNQKDYQTQIFIYKISGYANYYMKNYDTAIIEFEKALYLIEFCNIRFCLEEILQCLIKIYELKGDYKQASKHLRLQSKEKTRKLDNINIQKLDNIILEHDIKKERVKYELIQLQTKDLQKKSIDLENSMIAIKRLNDIGKYINSTLNLTEIINRIYYSNIEYLSVDFFSISLFDYKRNELTNYSYNNNSHATYIYKDFERMNTIISWTIRNKMEFFVSNGSDLIKSTKKNGIKDIFLNKNDDLYNKNIQIESLYCIPLIFEQRVLGAICFKSLLPNAYNNEKREYIKALSTYAAIAINNYIKTDILKNKINERVHIEEVLKNVNNDLIVLSSVDALSGVGNRRELDLKLQTVVYKQKTLSSPLSLLMIDIDKFKDYNDYYGHQQGDNCIKEVAQKLKNLIDNTDFFVGRYGGEEFVVILHDIYKDQTLAFAENIRESIENLKIEHKRSDFGIVTVSIGCTVCIPNNRTLYENIIEISDNALYKAKYSGRNRVFFIDFPND